MTEVVLGVQFAAPNGYSEILAYEVWKLFEAEFPTAQEQPALTPAFETFGPNAGFGNHMQLGFVTSAINNRFWFLSSNGEHLIQFQNDRLLHNWRTGEGENPYPRYEAVRDKFADELRTLEDYFRVFGQNELHVTQCEMSYINQVPYEQPQKYLSIVNFPDGYTPERLGMNVREILHKDSRPVARLIAEVQTGIKPDGQKVTQFNLTVRGAANPANIQGALSFLDFGREALVCKFDEFTTKQAHESWGRKANVRS